MLRRRNLYAVAIAASPGIAAIVAFAWVALAGGPEPWWIQFLGLAICASWLAVPMIWSTNAFAHTRRGELMVDRNGVAIEGELVVSAGDIASAVRTQRGWRGRPIVRLELRTERFACDLRVADIAAAEAVLVALQLDAAHASVSYVLPGKLFRLGVFPLVSILSMPIALGSVVIAAVLSRGGDVTALGALGGGGFAALSLAMFITAWRGARLFVTIGPAGLTVRKGDRERVIAWPEVATLEFWPGMMTRGGRARPAGFDLVLTDGTRYPMVSAHVGMAAGVYDRDLLADRINAARGAGA